MHFDRIQRNGSGARVRYRSYYEDLYGFIRSQVPPGSSVLDLGCGDGTLLASLRPSRGVGVTCQALAATPCFTTRPLEVPTSLMRVP